MGGDSEEADEDKDLGRSAGDSDIDQKEGTGLRAGCSADRAASVPRGLRCNAVRIRSRKRRPRDGRAGCGAGSGGEVGWAGDAGREAGRVLPAGEDPILANPGSDPGNLEPDRETSPSVPANERRDQVSGDSALAIRSMGRSEERS
jgi:hypothetical protein